MDNLTRELSNPTRNKVRHSEEGVTLYTLDDKPISSFIGLRKPSINNTTYQLDIFMDGSCIECYPLIQDTLGLSGVTKGDMIGGSFIGVSKFETPCYYTGDNGFIDLKELIPAVNNKGALTLSYWIKAEKAAPNYLSSPLVGTTNQSDETFYQYDWANSKFSAEWNSQNNVGSAESYDYSNADYQEWNHIVQSYDGSNIRLYINGVLRVTGARTGNTNIQTELNIARSHRVEKEQFIGNIHQVRFFNKGISQAEVNTLYAEVY